MRITESRLRRLIRSVLVESEMEDLKMKKARMMSLFENSIEIADVLNIACGSLNPKKMSSTKYYLDDEDIIDKAMTDKRLSQVYKKDMHGRHSLGGDDESKIKGVLRSILYHCSKGKKLSCIIGKEDVEKITSQFKSYNDIGATSPV